MLASSALPPAAISAAISGRWVDVTKRADSFRLDTDGYTDGYSALDWDRPACVLGRRSTLGLGSGEGTSFKLGLSWRVAVVGSIFLVNRRLGLGAIGYTRPTRTWGDAGASVSSGLSMRVFLEKIKEHEQRVQISNVLCIYRYQGRVQRLASGWPGNI